MDNTEGAVVNTPTKEHWYKWTGPWLVQSTMTEKTMKNRGYKPSTKPKKYERVVGFWSS